MRLSRKLLDIIFDVLKSAESKPADAALRQHLRTIDLEPEDRALISRAVFSYYRWFGFLDPEKPFPAKVERALDLAAQFAANAKSIPDRDLMDRALPAWAHEVMKLTPALIRELQREPRLWLRARPGNGAELAAKLGACEQHRVLTDAIWFKGSDDLYQTPEFRNGAFEIQDLSSQAVGILCDPQPAQIWWDACAGEGGKTLHLCDLMRNKGLVWASDPAEWRLKIMKRRAARANLFNYRVKTWQNPSHLPIRTKLDGILIDAPCSGIGTWGRNPHARWTTSPETVRELAKVQSDLLAKTAALLKPGGKLIYSVCTLTESETTIVADLFETTHREFQPAALANPLAPEERSSRFTIQPQAAHANGMFIAAWTRADK